MAIHRSSSPSSFERAPREELVRVVQDQLTAWVEAHGGLRGARVHREAGGVRVVCPEAGGPNLVAGVRLSGSPPSMKADLLRIVRPFLNAGVALGWWLGPSASDELQRVFRSLGFRCARRVPGMVRSAEPPESGAPTRSSTGLSTTEELAPIVSRIRSADEFETHPHPLIGEIRTPRRRSQLATLVQLAQLYPSTFFPLVVRRAEVPQGVANVFVSGGEAGIYDVEVRPDARGRGLGELLIVEAIKRAAEAGARGITLQSSRAAVPLYLRLGFKEVGAFSYWHLSRARGHALATGEL